MIDYETIIFNTFRTSVASLCVKNGVVSNYPKDLSKLPVCVFREMDNATIRKLQSSTPTENYARITYEFSVFASTRAKAKSIFATGDSALIAMGFTRIGAAFTDDASNVDVVRIVGRYECDIDQNGVMYRTS